MTPYDHRLTLVAEEAKVRTPHIFHMWHALQYPPFDPQAFASFTGLEMRHVERMLAALQSSGLMPEGPKSKRRAKPALGQHAGSVQGTRLPPAMSIPAEWIEFAQKQRHWQLATVELEFQTFLDYWCAVPGQKGVKLDWQRTWQNWCRRSHTPDGDYSTESNKAFQTPQQWRAYCLDMAANFDRMHKSFDADRWREKAKVFQGKPIYE